MKRIVFVVSWFYKTFTPNYYFGNNCPYLHVTLVNEKSIVSWKYMKSNKKCVFNVNFQHSHKQVPTVILVWCLIYINTYLIHFLCWYPSVESMKSAIKKLF